MISWLSPIVSVFNTLLTELFQLTHDWGLAIIVLTLIVRFLLTGLNLMNYRQMVRQKAVQPILQQVREKYKDKQERMIEETLRINKEHGIKPFNMLLISFAQIPIFMSLFGLFRTHGGEMSSTIVSWVDTLSQADPLHVLPILSTLLTLVAALIPITMELTILQAAKKQAGLSIVMNLFYLFVLWRSPIAIGLYYTSSAVFALMEKLVYRTRWGQKLLYRGMQIPVETAA
ncbi:YidC/Oxa1 family membrane protein insertase [Paenibacillus guangzhouensis]|uniref:YidC/Oxa1 family membrane protein insertase n=1 Tax=Paenibacillus guangzhouensis TaxID=1473112 RepID=UPI0012674928|nr:YidC/Oxa1 family membrane protein insertase [Paenibacillus guangzhouensis]